MRYKNRMMLYGIKKLIIQSVLLKVTLLDHKVLGLFLSGHETILSKRIWTLKDNNKPSIIKWRIIKQCRFCNNIRKKYNLRLFEKFVIIYRKNIWSLKLWWCKRVLSGDMLIVAVVVFFFGFISLGLSYADEQRHVFDRKKLVALCSKITKVTEDSLGRRSELHGSLVQWLK